MAKKSKTKKTNTMTEKEGESRYQAWIEDKKLADFTLVASSGEELICHKIFLAMNSPVFATMINGQFKEAKDNRATMKDFDATVYIFVMI